MERPILFSSPMVRAILAGTKTQTRRVIALKQFGPSDTPGYDWTFRDKSLRWQDVSTASLLESRCPFGAVGDRLWVRETWGMSFVDITAGRPFVRGGTWGSPARPGRSPCAVFRADGDKMPDDSPGETARWSPSIHMPRWASRITLAVTAVRVERLQDISEEDAKAEGVEPVSSQESWSCFDRDGRQFATFADPSAEEREEEGLTVVHQPGRQLLSARESFQRLWTEINGKRAGCSWADKPWVWVVSFKRTPPEAEAVSRG